MDTITGNKIEEFKGHLDGLLETAKKQLPQRDGIQALFVTTDGNECQVAPLSLKSDMKEIEAIMIETVCKDPSIIAAAVMTVVSMVTCTPANAKRFAGQRIIGNPNATRSLMAFLYTEQTTYVRNIPFEQIGLKDYKFSDQGWQEAFKYRGQFKNPLKK